MNQLGEDREPDPLLFNVQKRFGKRVSRLKPRPKHISYIRSVKEECRRAGISPFFI